MELALKKGYGWIRLLCVIFDDLPQRLPPSADGRELYQVRWYKEAITELERYLTLTQATWKEERAAALRHIAACHAALGQLHKAQHAALRGVLEWGETREPWLELARASYSLEVRGSESRWLVCVRAWDVMDALAELPATAKLACPVLSVPCRTGPPCCGPPQAHKPLTSPQLPFQTLPPLALSSMTTPRWPRTTWVRVAATCACVRACVAAA